MNTPLHLQDVVPHNLNRGVTSKTIFWKKNDTLSGLCNWISFSIHCYHSVPVHFNMSYTGLSPVNTHTLRFIANNRTIFAWIFSILVLIILMCILGSRAYICAYLWRHSVNGSNGKNVTICTRGDSIPTDWDFYTQGCCFDSLHDRGPSMVGTVKLRPSAGAVSRNFIYIGSKRKSRFAHTVFMISFSIFSSQAATQLILVKLQSQWETNIYRSKSDR